MPTWVILSRKIAEDAKSIDFFREYGRRICRLKLNAALDAIISKIKIDVGVLLVVNANMYKKRFEVGAEKKRNRNLKARQKTLDKCTTNM